MNYTDTQLLDHYERTHPYTSHFMTSDGSTGWCISNHQHRNLKTLDPIEGRTLREVLAAALERVQRLKL